MEKGNPLKRVWRFYVDGFKGLSKSSKTLWLIIFLKLFVMFAILKVFFFPNHSKEMAKELNMQSKEEFVQYDLIERGIAPEADTLNINK